MCFIFASVNKKQMDRDFIKILGYRALDSRFKRISDRMTHDIRKFYKELNIDIEPSWYLVFMLLKENTKLTIVEIAEQIGYAHPSVVVIIKKMTSKNYVITQKDAKDKRKQVVSLTKNSIKLLPEFEKLWDSCEKAILKMLEDDTKILTYLDNIDLALKETSFHDRFKNKYLKTK